MQLELLEVLVRLVLWAPKDLRDHKVCKEVLVRLAVLDLLELPEVLEHPDPLELLVPREYKDREVLLEPLVVLVPPVPLVLLVQQD